MGVVQSLEEKHRAMLGDMHEALGDFSERLSRRQR